MLRCLWRILLQTIVQVPSLQTSFLFLFLGLQPYLIVLFEEGNHHSRFLQCFIDHLLKASRKLHLLHDQQHFLFLTVLFTVDFPPVHLSYAYQNVLEVLQAVLAGIVLSLQQIKKDEIAHSLVDKFGADFEVSEEGMEMLECLFWIFLMHSRALYIFEVGLTQRNTL